MAGSPKKSKAEIATIDVSLVTIESEGTEIGFDTASAIEVEAQIEEEEGVKLVVKGILRAQKPDSSTLTGHEITLTDNVFNPELVMILQGGVLTWDDVDTKKLKSYTPPKAGEKSNAKPFTLCAYSANYDASGQIKGYEKITYPNCMGKPVALNSEDGAFRAPEYTIISAPATGQAPYTIEYVEDLPVLGEPA